MKKMKLYTMMLLLVVLVFVGCSSKDEEDPELDSTQSETNEDSTKTDGETSDGNDEAAADVTEEYQVDYTTGLDENGFHEDIKALDYVTLFDHKNISIPADVSVVSDASLQTEIERLLTYFVTSEQITDRAVVDGDTVNIDYVGSVDGVEFDGGNTGGAGADVTIGVTSYIDDFLEQLIGHTPGESFDIEVTFPEDYGVDTLNGKEAVFAITLNYISEEKIPELTDEFVAENLTEADSWSTVDELKAGMRDELQKISIRTYIQAEVFSEAEIASIPDTVMEFHKTSMTNYYIGTAASYNMPLNEFLISSTGNDSMDALYVEFQDQLNKLSDSTLIIQAIAEEAGLSVTEEVLQDYFFEYYGTEDYAQFEEQYGIAYLKYLILQDVVMDYLIDNAELL